MTINERANEYAKGYGIENALGGWEDLSDAYIAGATEQDPISRQDERERCINMALFAHCKVKCDGYRPSHYCLEICRDRQAIRKAIEE